MDKEALHIAFEELLPRTMRATSRALVHALIDLGRVTTIGCAWANCDMPDVPFSFVRHTDPFMTFDHVIALNDGGSDRPENIQLMHWRCNMRKGALFTDERRERISQNAKAMWRDRAYSERTRKAINARLRSPKSHQKMSDSHTALWADPAHQERMRGRRQRDMSPTMCERCGAGPFRGSQGAKVHRCKDSPTQEKR